LVITSEYTTGVIRSTLLTVPRRTPVPARSLDQHAPAAYVRTPVKATPISTCQRILDFYGEDYKGMRQEDLIR
jgi:hypothetical protein